MNWPAYAEYRGTGSSVFPAIPDHWHTAPLKRLGRIRYGIGEPPAYVENGTPLIRATNVSSGRIVTDGLVYVDPADIPAGRILWLQAGDIVVVRSGAYTGDSASITDEHSGSIAGFDMVLRIIDADPAFIQYSLLSGYLKQGQIDIARTRAAQPHLNAEELGSCLCILPPVREQRAVVRFLDRETAKIDAVIAKQEQLITTLREDRIATITHAVTRGLNPGIEMAPPSDATLPTSPLHWKRRVPLKHVASVQTGITLGKTIDPSEAVSLPYLRVANVQAGAVNLDEVKVIEVRRAEVGNYLLQSGDVLMTEGGDIDKLGRGCLWTGEIAPCIHQNHVFAVRCTDDLDSAFLVYLLETAVARNYFFMTAKQTTNLASTNSTTLGRFYFALPPHGEQREIVKFLDERCRRIEALIAKANEVIATLREYRSALITDAVTGKIDVRGAAA